MPNMASITVKNAAGVDVVYTAGPASSGDKNPARWRANALGLSWATRPEFTCATRSNARNTTRVIDMGYRFPVVDAVTGLVTDILQFNGNFTTVNRVVSTVNKDAFVQVGNLLVSTLLREVAETGYAPT